MLTLHANHPDTLWDQLLPAGVRALPDDLARLDDILADPQLLAPFRARFQRLAGECSTDPLHRGRPTRPMATYLRLMVIKHRTGWGYETLAREVSDSLHLRRFCQVPLTEPVPDESTVRKLTRRLGPQVVDEIIREIIGKALRERRFRPRALRSDSTVAEADIRYPTDAGLAADAVRVLARCARQVRAAVPTVTGRVQDRSRAVGKRLRALGRTLRRRTGDAKTQVRRLTLEAADLARVSVTQAKRVLARPAGPAPALRGSPGLGGPAPSLVCSRRSAWPNGSWNRPGCALRARRSPTGWCRFMTPTPAQCAAASWPSPTSSATWSSSPRSPPTPAAAPGGCCCPPSLRPARPTTTPYCLPPAELDQVGITVREAAVDAGFLRTRTE